MTFNVEFHENNKIINADFTENGYYTGYTDGKIALLEDSKYMKGSESGKAIVLADVSPVKHDLGITISKTGKNLFPVSTYKDKTDSQYGLQWQVNEDGTINVARVDGGRVSSNEIVSDEFTLAKGTYTFSSGLDGNWVYGRIEVYGTNGTNLGSTFNASTAVTQPFTFTLSKETVIYVKFIFSSPDFAETLIKPQIELGTEATEYEQYVEPVTGELSDITVTRYGKNLCDLKQFKPYGSGTITLLENGLTYTGGYYISLVGSFLPIGYTYYFKWLYSTEDNITPFWRIQYVDGTYSSILQNGKGIAITKAVKNILLYGEMTSTVHTTTFTNLQIEIGNATEYEPYATPQIVKANADGTVNGLKSLSPNVTILTDTEDITINCTYYRDIDTYIDSLTMAVAISGGE